MIAIGYHGCDTLAAQTLLGGSPFQMSDKPYDWLGTGAYFWEDDIERAYQWAKERRAHAPCVVGAVIDLGNCLDLTKQSAIRAVKVAYDSYRELQNKSGEPIPVNEAGRGATSNDLLLRYLDMAVIDHLHSLRLEVSQADGGKTKPYDTVRGMFPEGSPLYENAGFLEKTHVQIAVRKPEQVLGIFRVPAHQLAVLKLPDFYNAL